MSKRLLPLCLVLFLLCAACASKSQSRSVAEAMESAQKHLAAGDFESAIADLDRAIELDPDSAAAHRGRAMAYLQRGGIGRITDYDPDDADMAFGLQSDLDLAIADFSRAIELDPDDAMSYIDRGIAYDFKGDPDRAINDFNRAIELDPDEPEGYRQRAGILMANGYPDQAIVDFDRTIELDPNNPNALNGRAMAHVIMGDLDQAIIDLDRVVELTPEDPLAYKNRGVVCADLGRVECAITAFREMLRLSTDPAERQFAEEQLTALGATP